jgi:hypothetical protein
VAFNGFPGQDVQSPIGTLLVQQKQATVRVPAKPARVAAAHRGPTAASAAHRRRASLQRSHRPLASTGPLAHRAPTQQPGSGTTSPGATQNAASVVQAAPSTPIDTTAPSLPNPGVSIPQVTVPSLPSPPPPPSESQLPVDTSGVTGILGNP